jgi:hypothetical protein
VPVSATVTNLSGKEIVTPITWSVDDSSVAKTFKRESDGADVVVACAGAQGKSTLLRAKLENGMYAVSTISVTTHTVTGVTPVSSSKRVYQINSDIVATDTVWFNVSPWAIIDDFNPTAKLVKTANSGPSEMKLTENPICIDRTNQRVGVALYPDRSYGTFTLTLTAGGNGTLLSGSSEVVVGPSIKVGMWDPDLEISAPTGDQFYGFTYEVRKTIDINSSVSVYARVMIDGGRDEDVANAKESFKWEIESGTSLLISGMEERSNEYGFDAVLTLRSGISTGDNVIGFYSPDTTAGTMKAYITVVDFDKQYPVTDITVSPVDQNMTVDNLHVSVGGNLELNVGVTPLTSLAYQRPTVEISDPTVLQLQSYNTGTLMLLRGLKPGKATITLKSQSIVRTLDVTVNDEILDMAWASTLDNMIKGQTEEFSLRVTTASGATNPFDIKWTVGDSKVLSVAKVSGSTTAVKVTALEAGTTTLTASVTTPSGKTFSVSRSVTVKAGLDDVQVNSSTLNSDGLGYTTNGSKGGFYISLKSMKSEIWIYTKNVIKLADFKGTLTGSDFTTAEYEGSDCTVTDANLTISNNDGGGATVDGYVTLSLAGSQFKVVISNQYCWHGL